MIHTTELHNIPELIKKDRKIVKHLLYDVSVLMDDRDIKRVINRKYKQSKANEKYLEQAFTKCQKENDYELRYLILLMIQLLKKLRI